MTTPTENSVSPTENSVNNSTKSTNLEQNEADVHKIQQFEFNQILKESFRFKIMFLLYRYIKMSFPELQRTLKITSGNLTHHLKKLKEVEWVEERIALKQRTIKYYIITPLGEDKFEYQIRDLKKIIESIEI